MHIMIDYLSMAVLLTCVRVPGLAHHEVVEALSTDGYLTVGPWTSARKPAAGGPTQNPGLRPVKFDCAVDHLSRLRQDAGQGVVAGDGPHRLAGPLSSPFLVIDFCAVLVRSGGVRCLD